MPEGPEVKYLTNFLNTNLKNKTLDKITINGGRYQKHGPPKGYNKFIKELPLKIKSVNCYGKFIWWEFHKSEMTLWNTLGMSGWWNFDDGEKHNNLSFFLKKETVHFNDVRNFGTFIFCDKKSLEKKLAKFGADILIEDKTKDNGFPLFQKKLEKKRSDTFIATALLDQGVAAGCGNYIRAEVLYLAKISPFRKLEDLSEDEIELIWNLLQQVGYNYYNKKLGKKLGIIDGKYKFAEDYKRQFLVYTQDKDVKGNKVVREKIKDRSIHHVPKIQK
jgi:DNA-formamidopyrimidine glycosylase